MEQIGAGGFKPREDLEVELARITAEADATAGPSEAEQDVTSLFGSQITGLEDVQEEGQDEGYSPSVLPASGWRGEYYDPEIEDETLPSFTAIERNNYERAMFEQMVPNVGSSLPRLPWEQGIFAQIFGGDPLSSLLGFDAATINPAVAVVPSPVKQERPLLEAEEQMRAPLGPIPLFAKHVKALAERDYLEILDLTWTRGLALWLTIVESGRFEAAVGVHVEKMLSEGDREGALLCLRDACGIRSPNTVLKRGRDLQSFLRWCWNKRVCWWPLHEETILSYLRDCEARLTSKFIGKHLIHALKFYKYVFGANFELETVITPLISGRVSRVLATREPTEQARPLQVLEVKILENLVSTMPNILDRYFAGCFTFALMSRARWSDLAHIQSIMFDVIDAAEGPFGFVEAKTRIHKTSTTAERKAMYMPFVAPIMGVGPMPWTLEWKKTLDELGIDITEEPFGAICRAPGVDGRLSRRPLSSAEASSMLNGFLGTMQDNKLSSHSLKATTLVWAARAGLGDRTRSLLGHHSLKDQSMAVYSRDLLAQPMRELCAVLQDIRDEKFLPDGTRSGWLRPLPVQLDEHNMPPEMMAASQARPTEQDVVNLEEEVVVPSWDAALNLEGPAAAQQPEPVAEGHGAVPENEDYIEELDEAQGEDFAESASSDSDDSTSGDSSENEERFHDREKSILDDHEQYAHKGDLMQNKRSKLLHLTGTQSDEDGEPVTKCGLHGAGFVRLIEGSRFSWPKCKKCFKEEAERPNLVSEMEQGKRRRVG